MVEPPAVRSLIAPSWIAPVRPARTVLADHAIAVGDDGRIVAIEPLAAALARWPGAALERLEGRLVIPGLVNAHTHAAMALLRGAADDLPLERWLRERIWPLEAALADERFVEDGALLATREMLFGGVTCFNDMYFFPESTVAAARAAGMRVAVGIIVLEFATAYASSPAQYLSKGLALRDACRDDARVSFTLAPHAPYTVSDETLTRVAALSGELGLPVHVHLHETAREVADGLARDGVRPLERLRRLGLVGPDLIAVHAVHLDDADIALLGTAGASVVHCPHSNLKLASGIAPVAALLRAGVNVAIGTDGSASNNRLDLIAETRTAALLAKGAGGDAAVLDAHAALEAATLAGARALGLDARIGSLEAGKSADCVAIDLRDLDLAPMHDPVAQLLYSAGREHVESVWIDGRPVVHARQAVDPAFRARLGELVGRCALWQTRIGETLLARS